jgi:hypothetical protein
MFSLIGGIPAVLGKQSLTRFIKSCRHVAAVLVCICAACGPAAASASGPHYVVTNDDEVPFFVSGVTFYTVDSSGLLTLQQQVPTGGSGNGGGYFSANRVAVLDTGATACVYASEAESKCTAASATATVSACTLHRNTSRRS